MDTNELLRLLCKKLGTKQIADALGISVSLVQKWSGQGDSHRTNPLEDFIEFAVAVKWDAELMHSLCAEAGGYFVHNPEVTNGKPLPLDKAHYKVLHDLAQTLALITREAEHDSICKDAAKIRRNWDGLKSLVEGFVVGCEKGCFRTGTVALGQQGTAKPFVNGGPPQARV
jgi:hypothetical protein